MSEDISSNRYLLEMVHFPELENRKRDKVYEEVPYTGRKCVSVTWVFKKKYIDEKKESTSKVSKGFWANRS